MQLEFDSATNALRISASGALPVGERESLDFAGTLDIGEGGRLMGIELRGTGPSAWRVWLADSSLKDSVTVDDDGSGYVTIAAGDDRNVRSVDVTVVGERANGVLVALTIPRNGPGYEISYPSGNQ